MGVESSVMASEKKRVDDTTLPLLTPKLPRIKDRRGSSDSLVKLMQRIRAGQPERRGFRERRPHRASPCSSTSKLKRAARPW